MKGTSTRGTSHGLYAPCLKLTSGSSSLAIFGAKEWLGDFIAKVRSAPIDSFLSPPQALLEDLEDINDYSKKYHHETNPSADSEPINDGELRSFVRRTLEVVGGY